jgi:hypothetical protein
MHSTQSSNSIVCSEVPCRQTPSPLLTAQAERIWIVRLARREEVASGRGWGVKCCGAEGCRTGGTVT